MSFTKDQFGKETLRIDLLGEGGQFKSQLQKIKYLFIFFAVSIFLQFPLIYYIYQNRTIDSGVAFWGFILIFIYALGFYLFGVDTVLEIDKELILKNKLLFKKIPLNKTEINCNELDYFEVIQKNYNGSLCYELIAFFKNENQMKIYTGYDLKFVNALEKVIEKFLGMSHKSTSIQPQK